MRNRRCSSTDCEAGRVGFLLDENSSVGGGEEADMKVSVKEDLLRCRRASISIFSFSGGTGTWNSEFAFISVHPPNDYGDLMATPGISYSLPPELLCQIFDSDTLQYDDQVIFARVCKSWCDIVASLIWKKVPNIEVLLRLLAPFTLRDEKLVRDISHEM